VLETKASDEIVADLRNMKLVVHHHAVCCGDERGKCWIPSFIGRWVDALAGQFGEVSLLVRQSETAKIIFNITLFTIE